MNTKIDHLNPLRTRSDLSRLALLIWEPLERIYRERGAGALFGDHPAIFGPRAASMEGLARALWGIAPLGAGGEGGGVDWGLVRNLIFQGTGDGPGSWGRMGDFDQRIVEAPAIAMAMVWARSQLWDRMADDERAQLIDWLGQINKVEVVRNNWLWFRILTNAAIRALGTELNANRDSEDFAALEEMWHGDRGYSDGPDGKRDYYIPMAMHVYGLLYAGLTGSWDPGRAEIFRARAREFSAEFLTWFARNGDGLPFGRSMQYRFAQASLWSALAFAGEPVFSWGILKGLLLRHLRRWLDRPIFDSSEILTVGYGYSQPHMAEAYCSAQSPYWCQKAFLVLALPEDHPFWTSEEEAQPELPRVSVLRCSEWVLQRSRGGEDAIALSASRNPDRYLRHQAAKYHKFAYSARHGFSVPSGVASLEQFAPDSTLALSDDGGLHWRSRETSERSEFDGEILVSVWRPWPDVVIETRLQPDGDGHLRTHRIVTDRPLRVFEGGFALPRDPDTAATKILSEGASRIELCCGSFSEVRDPDGRRTGRVIESEPSTHLLWPRASIPGLECELPPGEHRLTCRVEAALAG